MPDKRVTELAAIDTVIDTDLVMVIDDPAGTAVNKKATRTQLLVDVARTNISNTFLGDQTVDGDLFVTGDVIPVARLAAQKPKIDLFTGTVGDPAGSRTLLSRSLVSGLSLRHDETLAQGRLAVGNYDTQTYQPLLFEVESFQVHTGVSPGDRVERLRVHPSGGVTVGADHTVDPGSGVVAADGVTAPYLDLAEGVPLNPPLDIARLHALDVNGFTQVEVRDAAARVVRLASDNVLIAKVTEPAGVSRGQCLYLAGASGANPLVGLAQANDIATMPTIGLALDDGAMNAFIRVLLSGTLQRLDTSAFVEGVSLFVSTTTAGGFTTTLPNAPNFAQRVGFVTRSHAAQGEVLVLTTSVVPPPRLHVGSHEPGGVDALTALSADILTTGTLPDARLTVNVLKVANGYPGGTATFLRADGTFAAPPAGAGDVVGPATATHNAIALFSGTTGKLLKDSAVTMASMAQKNLDNNFSVNQTFQGTVTATGLNTTPLNATNLLSGSVPFARVPVSAASKLLGRGASGAGAMEEIVLGTGLTMSGTTLNASGVSLPATVAYTDAANVFTQPQKITGAGSARLDLRDTSTAPDSGMWRIDSSGGVLYISPCTDAGVPQSAAVNFYRGGSTEWYSPVSYYSTARFYSTVRVDGKLTAYADPEINKQYPRLSFFDPTNPADGRLFRIASGGGGDVVFVSLNDDATVLIATPLTLTRAGHAMVQGLLQIGGSALSASLPALRANSGRLEIVTGTQGAYAGVTCQSIATQGTGNSLGDLTVSGGTNFQNGVSVTGGNVTTNGFFQSVGVVYPGRVDTTASQGSWYLASHGSFGLYSNTGIYCAGDVWAAGVSVTNALAGKHPLMTASGGNGPITLGYTTYSASHNSPTSLAAPAGGTGIAAGGWSTAANRDAAITTINALRTDVANTKQVLGHVITSLKGMGILLN